MFLRVVNIYVSVITNCKTLLNCFIFYRIMRPLIWLKPSLVPLFLAFNSHSRFFCVNDYITKMYTKIACNNSFGGFEVRLQVMQPFLDFLYLFSPIKYIL